MCELSTVDTALLLAGMLTAAAYFSGSTAAEREIRMLADELYLRTDWEWATKRGLTVTHGWKPENGFLRYRWQGYDEALVLYLLAWVRQRIHCRKRCYAAVDLYVRMEKGLRHEFLYSGPLFTHQISHLWIDFRGIQDDYMRGKGIDYFENSRRATYVQQRYAIDNPAKYDGYSAKLLGHHRERWTWAGEAHDQGTQTTILRL